MDIIDSALNAIASGGSAPIPSGAILDFAGATAPSGYLLCYGQNVDRAAYADLFAVIGTIYGVGDGSTTFGLPDLRGRIGAGKDDMGGTPANRLTTAASGVNGAVLASTGGLQTHTLTIAEMPVHDHQYQEWGAPGPSVGWDTFNNPVNYNENRTTGSSGGGGAHNNVQPTIILNKIIKT